MIWLAIAAARPLPLTVEVERWKRPEWPVRTAPPERPVVPDARVTLTLDGEPTEWANVAAIPLRPFPRGHAALEADLRIARTDGGIAVSAVLPEDAVVDLVVDGLGAGQRWLHVQRDGTSALCTLDGYRPPRDHRIPRAAVPCTPTEATPVAEGQTWEAAVPVDSATDQLRVLVRIEAPGARGGTLHPSGAKVLDPVFGVALGRPAATFTARERHDGFDAVLAGPDGEWTWRAWHNGGVLREGTLAVVDGRAELSGPAFEVGHVVLEARDEQGHGALVQLRKRDNAARLASPVFDDAVVLHGWLSTPRPTTIEVRNRRGKLLGTADVQLPMGHARYRVPLPEHKRYDDVRIEVVGLMDPARALRATR